MKQQPKIIPYQSIPSISEEEARKAALALSAVALTKKDPPCGLRDALDALSLREMLSYKDEQIS